MTTIESPTVRVGTTPDALRELVRVPANLEGLLPAGKISDFSADAAGCHFKLPGGIAIHLGLEEVHGLTRYASRKGTPIRFHLDIHIDQASDNASDAKIVCEADLNPFTRMMAEKPLKELFDHIAATLEQRYPTA